MHCSVAPGEMLNGGSVTNEHICGFRGLNSEPWDAQPR